MEVIYYCLHHDILVLFRNEKYQQYSLDKKEKLAKLCIKYEKEHKKRKEIEKYSKRKRKYVKSSTIPTRFLSKAVREFYSSFTNKPAEFKKANQLPRRCCYNSCQYTSCRRIKRSNQQEEEKFREPVGGRKVVALEVNNVFFAKANEFYNAWLRQQEDEVPEENLLQFSKPQTKGLIKEYGVRL